jgi:hypothetical protein
VRNPILKSEEVQSFSKERTFIEFVRRCVLLQRYSISVHLRRNEKYSHTKSATHCLNYSSCSTCRTETGVLQHYRRANRLGYSVTVLDLQRQSRQQFQASEGPCYRSFYSDCSVHNRHSSIELSRQRSRSTGPTEAVLSATVPQ